MSATIRRANQQDTEAIAHLIDHCFGDEVETQHIRAVIAEDKHAIFVAESDGKVIGFVDNFITVAQDGTRRCELDLLGVHVEFHGRGIGKKLIAASTQAGRDFGAAVMRVLVAATNTPMYAAMNKTGYQQLPDICRLYISSAQGREQKTPDAAYLVPVNTISYRGIWLEGEISSEAIQAAMAIREKHNWDVIGIVIPSKAESTIQIIEASNFHLIGNYYRWEQVL